MLESNKKVQDTTLGLIIRLILLTHKPNTKFGSYFNKPFSVSISHLFDNPNFPTISLTLVSSAGTNPQSQCLVFQASKISSLETASLSEGWDIQIFHSGKWVNELVLLVQKIESENFKDLDDSNFFL